MSVERVLAWCFAAVVFCVVLWFLVHLLHA